MELINNYIALFTESAPYLLLGLFLAGVIRLLIPGAVIEKHLGKNSSVLRAALIGTPLPLCSCSVIPTALGIRRAGASKASTTSFMIATPETGLDSIAVTYALMGPLMAIARPISAISSAVLAGFLVKVIDTETPASQEELSTCCKKSKTKSQEDPSYWHRFKGVLQYGYGKLLADFMHWLLIGLFFAALIQTYLPASLLSQYGSGILTMLAAVIISIPMYICATASTPIAAGLILSGVSPGAALVFMLTGPATNIATLMVLKNELGFRSLAAYLCGVIFTALISGLLLDMLLETYALNIKINVGQHDQMTSVIYSLSALLLAGLIALQYAKKAKALITQ